MFMGLIRRTITPLGNWKGNSIHCVGLDSLISPRIAICVPGSHNFICHHLNLAHFWDEKTWTCMSARHSSTRVTWQVIESLSAN